jgi:hypothetical protein
MASGTALFVYFHGKSTLSMKSRSVTAVGRTARTYRREPAFRSNARIVNVSAHSTQRQEVMPGVFSGHVRLCLGHTKPDGGSDIATCRTRPAERAALGDQRVEDVHHRRARVSVRIPLDPHWCAGAPAPELDHLLVPLHTPGVEIQAVRTVDGERTNIVYYDGVRIDDKYRLGEVNGGWAVLRETSNTEHGAVDAGEDGSPDVSILEHHGGFMPRALDHAAAAAGSADRVRGNLVAADIAICWGRSTARIEAAI